MFDMARRLRAVGVLGLNERNSDFIMRLNPRRLYPRVDDKALTKELAIQAGMAVPDLYGIIANQGDVRRFPAIVAELDSFVIKPAQGSGGNGILVITGRSERKRHAFRLSSGVIITQDEILYHLSNIVGGQYSLSGNLDKALVEYCVQFDPVFADVSYQAMAMVRLPTRASDGKANLHQGAVGAGIDMGTGVTMNGVLNNEIVDEHPDTGALVAGLEIPNWDFILESSAKAFEVTGLGYLGVDMVIDRDRGPLILEMNARPGLNIQIANATGLRNRIARIEEIYDSSATAATRAAVARREFGV